MQSTMLAKPEISSFADLGLKPSLLKNLTLLGYTAPTAIQIRAIPVLLEGRDVLGLASTGTGKTAAFGLPLIQRIISRTQNSKHPMGLVLVPTRELAIQVASSLQKMAQAEGIKILAVYGGESLRIQLQALKNGVHIVVATPGRLNDHIQRRSFVGDAIEMVILDEADEMLDMGFADDLDAILNCLNKQRQTALFSATLPRRMKDIASKHLKQAVSIEVAPERQTPNTSDTEEQRVQHLAYIVPSSCRTQALCRILQAEEAPSCMVFCRTRFNVDDLTFALQQAGHRSEGLHGGLSQSQRDGIMTRFRSGKTSVLVATDIAARGIDIDHVSHVVNYELPESNESYTHRMGRTGRAGRKGVAITLISPQNQRRIQQLSQHTPSPIRIIKLPTIADMQLKQQQKLEEELLALTKQQELLQPLLEQAQRLLEKHPPQQLVAAALLLAQGSKNTQKDNDDLHLDREVQKINYKTTQESHSPRSFSKGRSFRSPQSSSRRSPRKKTSSHRGYHNNT